ncbi:hypothetical protein [Herbaspirillum sp. YR522]|uniref:hypothetical protein n=1 Tax=Herbaspirillum sp. YR522 TaxID=1144342 RepID=UPI00026FA256|nr:hypothetical protein [Herbaspirillum sp. YR522]EJN07851.1 hypothetical protein PMI40_01604 [Herbaspirillum sp. YR522]
MRIITTTTAAIALTLFATAARAGSIFDGAFDYESPIAMILHVGANIVGKMFS